MRTIVFIYWLLPIIVSAKFFEVNSPTDSNIREVISFSEDGKNYETYIFGDAGFGAASFDKCVNWQTLSIDPVLKRDIKSALRVDDNLLIVLGSNGLLKYSQNKGKEFKDLLLNESEEVVGMTSFHDSLVAFAHIHKGITVWNTKSNSQQYAGYSSTFFECYGIGFAAERIFAWGNNTFTLWSGQEVNNRIYYFDAKTLSVIFLPNTNYKSPLLSASVVNMHSSKLAMIYTLRDPSTTVRTEYYRGPLGFWTTTYSNNLLGLTAEQKIRSSFFNVSDTTRWHVGGTDDNRNGFILRNGELVESFPAAMNKITSSGRVVYNEIGAAIKMIAVGEAGRILSNDVNLFRKVIPNAPKHDYIVSDTIVYLSDLAAVRVSGSEAGVSYKIFRERGDVLVGTVLGDGKPWSFVLKPTLSEPYYIAASKSGVEINFLDKAEIGVALITSYAVSDTSIQKGATVFIRLSGSQIGASYSLRKDGNYLTNPIPGTGGPLVFTYQPTETMIINIRVDLGQGGEYGHQSVFMSDFANIIMFPVSAKEISLSSLSVSPNPCDDWVVITSDQFAEAVLADQIGHIVKQFRLEQGNNYFPVSNLKPGMYYVSTKKHVFKLLKR